MCLAHKNHIILYGKLKTIKSLGCDNKIVIFGHQAVVLIIHWVHIRKCNRNNVTVRIVHHCKYHLLLLNQGIVKTCPPHLS